MSNITYKSVGSESIEIDFNTKKVAGYLSSFGNVDSWNDIIIKGAFAKTIKERKDKILFLFQHNWQKPLGKFTELVEDDKGLYFEAEIVNTTYGEDLIKLYASKLINEHSIGFQTIKSETDNTEGIRHISEIKLYEGSAVTLGANSETPFLGFKGMNLEKANSMSANIINFIKKNSTNITEETLNQLEYAIKQLEAYSIENKKNTLDIIEPKIEITLKDVEPLKNIFNKFKI